MHPLTSLLIWLTMITQVLLLPYGPGLWLAAGGVLAVLVVWSAARYRLRYVCWLMIPMALGLYLVHGDLLIVAAEKGVRAVQQKNTIRLWLRIFIIFTSAQIWMQYVPTRMFMRALFASKLPLGFSFLLVSPLLLVEQLSAQIQIIREAQLARGIRLDGSFLHRAKGLTAMVWPLINSTMTGLATRVAALESKAFCYTPHRTTLWAPPDSRFQKMIRYGLCVFLFMEIIGVGIWRWQ